MEIEGLPAGAALERTLEEVECAMYADLYAAAPPDLAAAHGLGAERVGSELRLVLAAVDHPFFNRVMGVGLDGRLDDRWLDAQVARYREAGISRYMLQVLPHAESEALRAAFATRGLVRLRGWAKHIGPAGEIQTRPGDLHVEPIGRDRAAYWATICAEGFSFPPAFVPWLEALVGRPAWFCYLAFDGETPVGCAAYHARRDFATLTFAATRPAAQRRGAQSALIARRVADAAASGIRWIVTETDEERPDRPNPSTRNVVRLGFPVHFVRANWGPPPPAVCSARSDGH